jgi:hypothetical protein
MRVESMSSRLDFDERRARALEGVVMYRPGTAAPLQPAPGAESRPADEAEQAERRARRRRRRGRRRPGERPERPEPGAAGPEAGPQAAPAGETEPSDGGPSAES